jgi:parallel beta-helix repeat protein
MNKNYINLIGENRDTTIIDGKGGKNVIYISVGNVNIKDFILQNSTNGIDIRSGHNTITNNKFSNIGYYGIGLFGPNCNIVKNSFFNCGLYCYFSNHTVENNTVNNRPLVYLEDKSDEIIKDAGQVILYNCNNIVAENLNLSNTTVGIQCRETSNSKIRNNDCSNNNIYGIFLRSYCNTNIITSNTILNNSDDGIYFEYKCNSNSISDNIISNNGDDGIDIWWSENNNIIGNTINSNNYYGIIPHYDCNNNDITGNTILNNNIGIWLLNAYGNRITGNTILNNNEGIYVGGSNNIITENTVDFNRYGIRLIGDSNNIYDNNISNNDYGMWFGYSEKNTIRNNKITLNNDDGIYLFGSDSNSISGNIISNNQNGIYSEEWSEKNTISANKITLNNDYGIILYLRSDNNIIYRNNLVDNGENAYDECDNNWDDGLFGNYWDDYKERYSEAEKKWWRGIWDTPYEIAGGDNKDMYPLIREWPNVKPRTITRDTTPYDSFFMRFLDGFPILKEVLLRLIR